MPTGQETKLSRFCVFVCDQSLSDKSDYLRKLSTSEEIDHIWAIKGVGVRMYIDRYNHYFHLIQLNQGTRNWITCDNNIGGQIKRNDYIMEMGGSDKNNSKEGGP